MARTTIVSASSICSGSSRERQHRRDREGREQRAEQRVAVGARHRAENLAFDALHREQRDEGGHGDRGREEDRLDRPAARW